MSTLKEDLTAIKEIQDGLVSNKVARFSYTQKAYIDNTVDGVNEYNVNNEQNIPNGTASIMKVNSTVLDKGYRAQASSITRMLMNHFLGRISYNLNKINDNMQSLLNTLITSDLGLPPPDLAKVQTVTIVDASKKHTPFTVPSDGWILSFNLVRNISANVYIDNIGEASITPGQQALGPFLSPSSTSVFELVKDLHCPYPVKKGQLVSMRMFLDLTQITFAPCLDS